MVRVIFGVLCLWLLGACTADHIFASDDEVSRAHYVDTAPSSITLITSINTRSGTGAHSALIINGSERVLYDPAGSWVHPASPERNDLRYGITPVMLSYYTDFQGTAPFQVVQQTVFVSQAVADQAIAAAIAEGSAGKAECTRANSAILRQLPGFESIESTWFPKQLMKNYGQLPGVIQRTITSEDGVLKRSLPGSPLQPPPEQVAAAAPAG